MKVLEFTPVGAADCNVVAWFHKNDQKRKHPAMIICPGGGYGFVSEREAKPVAEPYFAAGYNTFILYYSVKDQAKDFYPLCQLAATIAHVRRYAKQWCVDEEKIAVCGFSAGGHLAASLGTLFNEDEFQKVFRRGDSIRPNAMVLCYPVITSDEFAHTASICNVSGSDEGSEKYKWFGLDRHVDEQTPPTFLWHTAEDKIVPVENSLKMAAALSKAKIPFELHIFPYGQHGMSVCTEEVGTSSEYNGRWVQFSITWLRKIFDLEL